MKARMQDDRPVFLVGFMGSGKTTVGRSLANRRGWEFVDTDDVVERTAGKTIAEIFEESGEDRFRQAEWHALRTLEGKTRCVVACGGGLVIGHAQRKWMSGRGRTVWLDCPLEVCVRRVAKGGGRPLWAPEDALAFRSLFDRRRALYALAEIRLDVSTDPADVLVDRLLARLGAVFH